MIFSKVPVITKESPSKYYCSGSGSEEDEDEDSGLGLGPRVRRLMLGFVISFGLVSLTFLGGDSEEEESSRIIWERVRFLGGAGFTSFRTFRLVLIVMPTYSYCG